MTSEASFARIGGVGDPILINPSRGFSLDKLGPFIEPYHRAWRAADHPGAPQVGLRAPIDVAETAERAYTELRASAMTVVQGLCDGVALSPDRLGTTGDWKVQAERLYGMDYDDWLRDKVAFGTPDAVVERLQKLQDHLGLTQLLYGDQRWLSMAL